MALEHPYERGRDDYADMKTLEANPFAGEDDRIEWERGWRYQHDICPHEN